MITELYVLILRNLILRNIEEYFTEAAPIYIPTKKLGTEDPFICTFLSTLISFYFSHSERYEIIACGLIFISLMMRSSLEKCLFIILCSYLIKLFGFLVCVSSLCILLLVGCVICTDLLPFGRWPCYFVGFLQYAEATISVQSQQFDFAFCFSCLRRPI